MSAQPMLLVIPLFALCTAGVSVRGGDTKTLLSGEDKKYLDKLMKDFLFDPSGAERVTVKVTVRSVWGGASEMAAEGWYVPGKDGKPGRVYFTDGGSITAPAED